MPGLSIKHIITYFLLVTCVELSGNDTIAWARQPVVPGGTGVNSPQEPGGPKQTTKSQTTTLSKTPPAGPGKQSDAGTGENTNLLEQSVNGLKNAEDGREVVEGLEKTVSDAATALTKMESNLKEVVTAAENLKNGVLPDFTVSTRIGELTKKPIGQPETTDVHNVVTNPTKQNPGIPKNYLVHPDEVPKGIVEARKLELMKNLHPTITAAPETTISNANVKRLRGFFTNDAFPKTKPPEITHVTNVFSPMHKATEPLGESVGKLVVQKNPPPQVLSEVSNPLHQGANAPRTRGSLTSTRSSSINTTGDTVFKGERVLDLTDDTRLRSTSSTFSDGAQTPSKVYSAGTQDYKITGDKVTEEEEGTFRSTRVNSDLTSSRRSTLTDATGDATAHTTNLKGNPVNIIIKGNEDLFTFPTREARTGSETTAGSETTDFTSTEAVPKEAVPKTVQETTRKGTTLVEESSTRVVKTNNSVDASTEISGSPTTVEAETQTDDLSRTTRVTTAADLPGSRPRGGGVPANITNTTIDARRFTYTGDIHVTNVTNGSEAPTQSGALQRITTETNADIGALGAGRTGEANVITTTNENPAGPLTCMGMLGISALMVFQATNRWLAATQAVSAQANAASNVLKYASEAGIIGTGVTTTASPPPLNPGVTLPNSQAAAIDGTGGATGTVPSNAALQAAAKNMDNSANPPPDVSALQAINPDVPTLSGQLNNIPNPSALANDIAKNGPANALSGLVPSNTDPALLNGIIAKAQEMDQNPDKYSKLNLGTSGGGGGGDFSSHKGLGDVASKASAAKSSIPITTYSPTVQIYDIWHSKTDLNIFQIVSNKIVQTSPRVFNRRLGF